MCKKTVFYNVTERPGRRPLELPDIPQEQWCDFRAEYEKGRTLRDIAESHLCDPRTVRRCILQNKPSSALGSQTAPTKIAPFHEQIEELYDSFLSKHAEAERPGICEASRWITEKLRAKGYEGGERTVRNHLRGKYYLTYRPGIDQEKGREQC